MMPPATLTTKGQMVIPKAIRDRLGLQPGDQLDFILLDNGDVLLRPVSVDVRALRGLLHRPGRKAVSVAQMGRAVRRRASGRRA